MLLAATNFTAAWSAGHGMGWEDAAAYALETLDLAMADAQKKANASPRYGSPITQPGFPDGLTARRDRSAAPGRQRLTDAQVAAQLVISPRTVNTDVSSVYNKLGISSCTAAARYVIQHHLV